MSSIPKSGRSPGEGNDNPLQYSCLENPTAEPGGLSPWAAKNWTRLSIYTAAPEGTDAVRLEGLRLNLEQYIHPKG